MDDLPSCLLMSILSRLPVISILRSRSVSKLWLQTIDDPTFRNMLKTETVILGVSDGNWKDPPSIYRIRHRRHGMAALDMGDFKELLGYRLKNSCNGWLYFEDQVIRQRFKSMILNPFTRKVVHVPDMPGRGYDDRVERALGFDKSTGTFKLLQLSQRYFYGCTGEGLRAATYNFKTRCWTPCEAPRCPSHVLTSCSIHASDTGTLYWITGSYKSDPDEFNGPLLLSFDMEKEEFRFIPLPRPITSVHMTELNGRLTLCHARQEHIDVYELVDRQSHQWGRTYRIPSPPTEYMLDLRSYSPSKILVASPAPKAYHPRTKQLYLYDIERNEWKDLGEVRRLRDHWIWIRVHCLKLNLTPLEVCVFF